MACGPPQLTTPTPSITRPRLVVTLVIPQPIITPRYHYSFQDFLDDIDAESFNPHPSVAHLY